MSLPSAVRRFHGRGVRTRRTWNFSPVRGLVILGRAVAIEYECDKLNGGGDGTKAVYRHRFGKGAVVCADQNMRRQLYILGPSVRVTSAGIEG